LLVMSPVQRSDYGRRDPRFDFGRRDPRFCWTPPRVSLELGSLAHPTVTGHQRPAMLYILPHTHAVRCRRPGPAPVYLASQPTVSGTVNTARISYLGCALRTARLSGFPRTRPHPCVVAAHHILHARPPDASGCAICLAHPELASDLSLVLSCAVLPAFDTAWRTHVTPIHSNRFS